MKHPFFRKHITHLIYDASWFDKDAAASFERYEASMHDFERLARGPGHSYEVGDYQRLWERIHKTPAPLRPIGRHPRARDREDLNWQITRSSFLDFVQYAQRWLVQESIDQDPIHRVALKASLVRFPKLRHVVFGDFRSQARHTDSSYEDLVFRLFGAMCEPDVLSFEAGNGWDDLWQVLKTIAACPASDIRSISIGDNPWGFPLGIKESTPEEIKSLIYPALPLHKFPLQQWDTTDLVPYKRFFSRLHDLKLPLRFEEGKADSKFKRLERSIVPTILSWSTSNLVRLTLVSANCIDESNDGEFAPYMNCDGLLAKTLFTLHFRSLRCLDIRGWYFEADDLVKWLESHASTLKQLRTVDNIMEGSVPDFAARIGKNMSLSGVAYANPTERLSCTLEEWREPPNPGDLAEEKVSRDAEYLMLCGRRNALFKADIEDWRRLETFTE